ncbi:hypothetical protein V8E51_018786 [Hyaloscypha variabilis]
MTEVKVSFKIPLEMVLKPAESEATKPYAKSTSAALFSPVPPQESTKSNSSPQPGLSEQNSADTAGSVSTSSGLKEVETVVNTMPQSGTSELTAIVTTGSISTTPVVEAIDSSTLGTINIEITFELFPKLPPELRLKIWKLVPKSRLVLVRFNIDGRKKHYKFAASFPVILHACRESRHEGLKMYHRAFDSKWALNGVYFNSNIDILRLQGIMQGSQKEFFMRKVQASDLKTS